MYSPSTVLVALIATAAAQQACNVQAALPQAGISTKSHLITTSWDHQSGSNATIPALSKIASPVAIAIAPSTPEKAVFVQQSGPSVIMTRPLTDTAQEDDTPISADFNLYKYLYTYRDTFSILLPQSMTQTLSQVWSEDPVVQLFKRVLWPRHHSFTIWLESKSRSTTSLSSKAVTFSNRISSTSLPID